MRKLVGVVFFEMFIIAASAIASGLTEDQSLRMHAFCVVFHALEHLLAKKQ